MCFVENKRFFVVFLMLGWIGVFSLMGYAEAGKKPLLHHVPASACGECHQQIYQQWQSSMHAQSSALSDPIHGAFYGMLIGDPTKEGMTHKNSTKYPICLQCHAPNAARDGKTKLDTMAAYAEGVNCVVCHTMDTFKGVQAHDGKLRLGAKAYGFSDKQLSGPRGAYNGMNPSESPGSGTQEKVVNPFPHKANATLFKTSNACLGCHEQRKNGNGVPVCATGPELVASGNTVTCQSCHMPVSNGFSNHTMGGGHSPAMLNRGVVLEVKVKSEGGKSHATVTLLNLLPHNYPTGAPFRNVVLKVAAFDQKGGVVWQNFKENPFKEDKQAVLMLKLVDDKGKPVAPPKAKKVAGDSRLKPNETRLFEYAIPGEGVVLVRAELFYNLLLPPLVKKFEQQLPPYAKTPVLVGRAEARL